MKNGDSTQPSFYPSVKRAKFPFCNHNNSFTPQKKLLICIALLSEASCSNLVFPWAQQTHTAMAYPRFPSDMADIDASLTSMIPRLPVLNEDDMVPLKTSQSESQHDNEDSNSDSSTPPQKPSLPRSRAKKARKQAHQTQQSKPLLRPANDILSRIRHDPALEESDFVIGYLDRHCPDVMEMDVSSWKGGGDFTDEEWIPQHRIVYFRKKSDDSGRKVWDRAARLDRLFCSGVVADEQEPDPSNKGESCADTPKEDENADRQSNDAEQGEMDAIKEYRAAGSAPGEIVH